MKTKKSKVVYQNVQVNEAVAKHHLFSNLGSDKLLCNLGTVVPSKTNVTREDTAGSLSHKASYENLHLKLPIIGKILTSFLCSEYPILTHADPLDQGYLLHVLLTCSRRKHYITNT